MDNSKPISGELLNRNLGVPLHVQLADRIRERITSGRWSPHSNLPSERELCEQYNISRITVRQALSRLDADGLIYTTPGKGRYVSETPLREQLLPLSSFTDDALRSGRTATNQVLELTVADADPKAIERLGMQERPPGSREVVRLKRLRLLDDAPIAIHTSYLPHYLCPGLARYDYATGSLFDVLRNGYGLHLARADTTLQAALATPEERRLLKLSSPAAVLIVDQTTYLDDGSTVEFLHGVYRGDAYTLVMRMSERDM